MIKTLFTLFEQISGGTPPRKGTDLIFAQNWANIKSVPFLGHRTT